MSYAELIAREVERLSPEKQAEVLAFAVALRSPSPGLPALSPDQARRRDELMAFFASFRANLSGHRFDREEANARR